MTVETEISRSGPYSGAGTTGPFTVDFRFLDDADLIVVKTSTSGLDTTLELTTGYSVSGAGGASGTVTLADPLEIGEMLTIVRAPEITQEADYVVGDSFPAESHERALDKLTMVCQRLFSLVLRSFHLPDSVGDDISTEIPKPEAGKIVAWNNTATALQNLDPNVLATIVSYGTANADTFSGDGVTLDFVLSGNPGALNNLDVSISGVTQTPGVDYLWSAGTTISFTTAPPSGTDNILVRYMQGLPLGYSAGDLVSFTQSGVGATVRTVQDKLRESASDRDFGSVVDGVYDDRPALVSMLSSGIGLLSITTGSHKLSSAWNPSAQDVTIVASPKAEFVTNAPNYSGASSLVPNIPDPIYSGYLARKNYTSAHWNTYAGNVMHHATVAETDATNMYAGGINLVSSFNFARANGAGSSVWGANIVAYSNNATANAIGIELNCGVLVSGGTAYGLVVASAGNFQVQNAVQVQANNASSTYKQGIDFNYSAGIDVVSGAVIRASGDGTNVSQRLLYSTGVSFSQAEIDIPSFSVQATVANTANRMSVRGAIAGASPRITPLGETDVGMLVMPRGTGTGILADGLSSGKFRWNQTGIGFNTTSPIAKPTVTGSRAGNAALADLLTKLSSYGLITDSTTA